MVGNEVKPARKDTYSHTGMATSMPHPGVPAVTPTDKWLNNPFSLKLCADADKVKATASMLTKTLLIN